MADFTEKTTIGEKYGPAMEIVDPTEAAVYFERLVAHCMRFGEKDRSEAERIERVNLGYYAGYYNDETRVRVERLFRCAHPVFGSIEKNGPPTAEAAFEAGLRQGNCASIAPSENTFTVGTCPEYGAEVRYTTERGERDDHASSH